jgi:hypothetical protein
VLIKTKQKIEIQWEHRPSKPIDEVRFTYAFNFGERFIAILPIGLVHKKTGIKVVTRQEVKEGEKLPDNYCWFVVQGTNANNISYEYRYNAGIGGHTRTTPLGKSSIGPWGSQRWVEDYINKNYILGEE